MKRPIVAMGQWEKNLPGVKNTCREQHPALLNGGLRGRFFLSYQSETF